ncbi:MAG: AmmeMemoRadiSam system radical SAM enzyme [candidate division Zixibacteria bacterium]|nr:AmmeMemoRadiSam system radical SAM enzyme [candidate division Zixibacteria bacterium]
MSDSSQHQTESLARYWTLCDDGRVQCDLCFRHCKLKDGQRGVCFVRQAHNQQLILTTYGRSTGFCVDPIEKKPLSHFYPGSAVLSFGTAGCNLKCKFCQNWDISTANDIELRSVKASPETIARTAAKLKCRSVAFTYNDPIVFIEYAIDVARACHERGIKTVAVTSGEINPEPRREFFGHIDAANVDLKAFTERFYTKLCGGNLKSVLDTLIYLKRETSVWLELTTLLIPGENDTEEEIEAMTKWVVAELGAEVPMHFTAFHPDWKMLDIPPTPPHTLTLAREIALRNGVRYVYTGNVHDPSGAATFCHKCGAVLIGRDWHRVTDWNLTPDSRCRQCGAECAGCFDSTPGDWNGHCQPVRLDDFV